MSHQYLVYPGHGVGRVYNSEVKFNQKYISLEIMDSGMKIMVPENNFEALGVRPLATKLEAKRALKIAQAKSNNLSSETWNTRYRGYVESLKTGSIEETAKTYAALNSLGDVKQMSFGERKIKDNAHALLLRELNLILGITTLEARNSSGS